MQRNALGLITGLFLGLALVLDGFGSMLVVALAGLIGWLVARVAQGEIDVGQYLSRPREGQRR